MRPKGSAEALEMRRMIAVRMLQAGKGVREGSRLVGVSPTSVSRWKKVLQEQGVEGLRAKTPRPPDGRRPAPPDGAAPPSSLAAPSSSPAPSGDPAGRPPAGSTRHSRRPATDKGPGGGRSASRARRPSRRPPSRSHRRPSRAGAPPGKRPSLREGLSYAEAPIPTPQERLQPQLRAIEDQGSGRKPLLQKPSFCRSGFSRDLCVIENAGFQIIEAALPATPAPSKTKVRG
jgi:hypothetical protein